MDNYFNVKRIIEYGRKKKYRLFISLAILTLLAYKVEYIVYTLLENSEGQMTTLGWIIAFLFYSLKMLLVWALVACILLLCVPYYKVIIFNVVGSILIIYAFEYYLMKTDPFLKLPFDSNYYHANIFKYRNFLKVPEYNGITTWGHTVQNNRLASGKKTLSYQNLRAYSEL